MTRESSSPDPLTLNSGDEEPPVTPSKLPRSRSGRLRPVVEIPLSQKSQTSTTPKKRTSVQDSPSKHGSHKTAPAKGVASGISQANGNLSKLTPTKSVRTVTEPTPTLMQSSAKRVAASLLAAAKSSHSPRKRSRLNNDEAPYDNDIVPPLRSFDDEVFGSSSVVAEGSSSSSGLGSGSVSREAFLANESLRRQREARNFTYSGDASAPRLTRSGRVVADRDEDEYGGGHSDSDSDQEGQRGDDTDVETTTRVGPIVPPPSPPSHVEPLLPNARIQVLQILKTLSSRGVGLDPPPFHDEKSNEPLQGLVNILRGTVERGEGNSALVTGPRGVGKTRTVARSLNLLPSKPGATPIIVRLSGHAQTDDRLAIREMGRQIAESEGTAVIADEEDDDDQAAALEKSENYAPTTLPSHLLALLTAPSPRAIIIIIEEFDLFTEHARQALLYCLLDVVQSVKTGPVETTGRGVAVIGVTSRMDTLLLLEKRVKSRFSHRVWRVSSPLSPDGHGWRNLVRHALIPWTESESDGYRTAADPVDKPTRKWMGDWAFAVDMLLEHEKVAAALDRLAGLTTDVRVVYRPFVAPITAVLSGQLDFLSVPVIAASVIQQLELAGWGVASSKLRGLPHPALGVLIVAKHLAYAGREEFSFAQVEDEYLKFARTRLVGSGRSRWPMDIVRMGFDHLRRLGLLAPAGSTSVGHRFAKVRSALSPLDIVAYFRGEGGSVLGPELAGWGRLMGGHA